MKIYSNNKKATYNYFIDKTFEAGIILFGYEVKSICKNKININEGYIKIINSEVYLYNVYIAPYENNTVSNIDPLRIRKLLLNRKEINQIENMLKDRNNVIVPIQIYKSGNSNKIKCNISVAKGKTEYDKRESIKEKDLQREKLY